jgi:hypothetical protein
MNNGCFYCNCSSSEDNDVREYYAHYRFGIQACDKHKENALRDIKICFWREYENDGCNPCVILSEAIEKTSIKELFEILGENIKIIRSNNEVDEEWKIAKKMPLDTPSIQSIYNEKTNIKDWCIPLKKKINGEEIFKYFQLLDFKEPRLKYIEIDGFSDLIDKICKEISDIFNSYKELSKNTISTYDIKAKFPLDSIAYLDDENPRIIKVLNVPKEYSSLKRAKII